MQPPCGDEPIPGQILIPASNLHENVTTGDMVRQVRLGDLVKYLSLVPVRTPLKGRATRTADAD
jgi:hypothetical protein